ncbi:MULTISPECIES: cupin domain-containing protein [unclassified Sphingomonas]|uniref:cupin domain-containing protein n=1 Tax=unclassified Sphingomonas TaxID=196159 RepID=UPI0022699D9E|nr:MULTISPECIES: cupin domain-containing protein [unclassified Sphingomonas]
MITSLSPPGGGPPPHIHRREDETLVALDPGFEVLIDGQWAALAIGSAAFIVRGTLHTFRNVGTQPARLVAHYTPAGFERFFALFALGGTPDNAMDRLAAAAASVGTQFFPGPLMNENMQSRWSSD